MATPTLQASGTVAAVTTGNLTVTLPAHQADDILIVTISAWVPNTTTGTNVVAAPAGGWAKLLSDPLINTTIDGEWSIFWLRATASGTTNPVFTRPTGWDTGTDTNFSGRAYVIRGCTKTGDPWDAAVKSALHSTANQALPAVTVSGTERHVIHFLVKADDNGAVTAATGWTLDTAAGVTTGTDASFQTIRKSNVSSSTTADTATITAPVTGLRYQFYGISFKPDPPTEITSVGSNSTTVSDAAQLTITGPAADISSVGSNSTTVSDTAQLTVKNPPDPTEIVSYSETSSFIVATNPKTITGLSWDAGDLIVIGAQASGNNTAGGSVPTNANLTFKLVSSISPLASSANAAVWAARANSAQTSQTVSVSTDGLSEWGASCWILRNAAGVSLAAANRNAAGSVSVTVPKGATVIGLFPDWDESNVNDTPDTGSGTVTERRDTNGGAYDQYVVDWENTNAGTFTFGYSATTGDTNLVVVAPPKGTPLATDDFNRANGALGSNWTVIDSNNLQIVSNVVSAPTASTGDNVSAWTASTFEDDQWAEIDIVSMGSEAGLVLRGIIGGGGDYYWAGIDAGVYRIYRSVNSTFTQLAIGETAVTNPRLRFEAVGTKLTLYANGVEVLTTTDSTYATGYPGIHVYRGTTNTTLDNFSAGDWSEPPVSINSPGSNSTTVSDAAQLTVFNASTTITSVGSNSTTASDTGQITSPGTPLAITDLAGTPGSSGAVNLTWTAPVGVQ